MNAQCDDSRQLNLLRQVGEARHGEHWQSGLSRDLGVSDRTVRRWAAGTEHVPEVFWQALHSLAESQRDPRNYAVHNADLFVRHGRDYYATARWAMYSQCAYVCDNLFHHAIEMLLKGGLGKKGKGFAELKHVGHNLKKLWRAYKAEYADFDLERHDKTINKLDKHEEIRYPDPSLHSIGVSIQWSGEPAETQTFGGLRSPKQYAVVVEDIDDLVADIFRTSSWNPGVFMGRNETALEAIKRHNKHTDFLTTIFKPGGGSNS
jgi:hypothetical protein